MAANPRKLFVSSVLAVCGAAIIFGLGTSSALAGTVSAVVSTGGPYLNVRSGPSTAAAKVGSLTDGAAVAVACQVDGAFIAGKVRSTARWDRLTNGNYVSDAYIQRSAEPPTCAVPAATTPKPGTGPVGGMTPTQFIAASAPIAQQSYREYKVPASVTIAQAILESGWGNSKLTANDKNFFGIKCFGSPGPIAIGCHTYNTTECEPECKPTTASFRVYRSALDSFRDHSRFLTVNSRYAGAFRYSKDANKFIYAVWKAGYATDPLYYQKITALMLKYNLYRYDVI